MPEAVNRQVTDAVTQTNVTVIGESPAQSMGLIYQSMGHSISLSMQNAVTSQNGMQQINAAAIATACRELLMLPHVVPAAPSGGSDKGVNLHYVGGNMSLQREQDTTVSGGASSGTSGGTSGGNATPAGGGSSGTSSADGTSTDILTGL